MTPATSEYLNRRVRSLDEYVMGLVTTIREFLEGAGSGLGAVATGGLRSIAWPENESSRGAAPASSKGAQGGSA